MYKIGKLYTINGCEYTIEKSSRPGGYFNVFVMDGGIFRLVYTGNLAECKQHLDDYNKRSRH